MKLPPGYEIGVGVKQASAYGGWGEKMLKKFGWADGQGLGKAGTGMREAIKVRKKDDNKGVSLQAGLLLRRCQYSSACRGAKGSPMNIRRKWEHLLPLLQVGASLRMEPEGRWWEDAFQGVISKLQPEVR